jgi:HSP20 family protein
MVGVTRWSPLGSVFQLHRELDDLFGRIFGQEAPVAHRAEAGAADWWPAMESYTQDGELHVRVALPGVDPKDVEVTVSDDFLTVRGERRATVENANGGRHVREFAYGSFERSLALPEGIDPGKVQAKFTNGMLDVRMPIPQAVAPRKVNIQIEGAAGQAKAVKTG